MHQFAEKRSVQLPVVLLTFLWISVVSCFSNKLLGPSGCLHPRDEWLWIFDRFFQPIWNGDKSSSDFSVGVLGGWFMT